MKINVDTKSKFKHIHKYEYEYEYKYEYRYKYKYKYKYRYKYKYKYKSKNEYKNEYNNTRGSKTCAIYGNSVQKAYDRVCLMKTIGGAAIKIKNGYYIGADFRVDKLGFFNLRRSEDRIVSWAGIRPAARHRI